MCDPLQCQHHKLVDVRVGGQIERLPAVVLQSARNTAVRVEHGRRVVRLLIADPRAQIVVDARAASSPERRRRARRRDSARSRACARRSRADCRSGVVRLNFAPVLKPPAPSPGNGPGDRKRLDVRVANLRRRVVGEARQRDGRIAAHDSRRSRRGWRSAPLSAARTIGPPHRHVGKLTSASRRPAPDSRPAGRSSSRSSCG